MGLCCSACYSFVSVLALFFLPVILLTTKRDSINDIPGGLEIEPHLVEHSLDCVLYTLIAYCVIGALSFGGLWFSLKKKAKNSSKLVLPAKNPGVAVTDKYSRETASAEERQ
eukprot:GHVH01010767.1.p1 GENE.GHVH01010767.1~~GHVH01010767.1.p1  ORF type:complete len:112 (+),score=13.07 GHVH01010767.1:36-371(+)